MQKSDFSYLQPFSNCNSKSLKNFPGKAWPSNEAISLASSDFLPLSHARRYYSDIKSKTGYKVIKKGSFFQVSEN